MFYYYQPTALEEAYGIFLLQTEFQITHIHVAFRIAGRQAVPFFCRSGVDRLLLRNMWSLVDPQVNGYMSEPLQFYTFLRLTALAQTGPLMRTMAEAPGVAPEEAMRHCLMQTASVMLPLAVFEGIHIPSNSELQTIYQRAKMMMMGTMPPASYTTTTTIPDILSTSNQTTAVQQTDYSQPSPLIQQQETAPDVAVLPTSLELTSIDDAFSGLVEVEDKPLPSLFTPPKSAQGQLTTNDDVPNVEVDDDDFGDFVDSASNQGSLGANSRQDNGLSSFSASQQPIPDISTVLANIAGENILFQKSNENTVGDEMVVVPRIIDQSSEDISRQVSQTPTQMSEETFGNLDMSNEVPSIFSTGGAFGHSSNPPVPLKPDMVSPLNQGNTDEFEHVSSASLRAATSGDSGGFGEWATSTIGSNAASSVNSIMSISEAFGGLTEIPDRPLPPIASTTIDIADPGSIEQNVSFQIQQSPQKNEESGEITATETKNVQLETDVITAPNLEGNAQRFPSDGNDVVLEKFQNDEDETEFGDFASTEVNEIRHAEASDPVEPPSAPAVSWPAPGLTQGAGEFDMNLNHTDGELSGWDALDALSELQDRPLPRLGTLSGDADDAQNPIKDGSNGDFEKAEDDDFGEFVGDPSPQAFSTGFDAFQQSASQNLLVGSTYPLPSDAFDTLERMVSDDLHEQGKVEDSDVACLSMSRPLARSLHNGDVDDGDLNDFGDFVAGDHTTKEQIQIEVQPDNSSSNSGHVVASELESGEKQVITVSPDQQSTERHGEQSGWDAFEALSGNSFDEPVVPHSAGNNTTNDTQDFALVDKTTLDEMGSKDEGHQYEKTPTQLLPLSFDSLEETCNEVDGFGAFAEVAAVSSANAGFDVQSLPLDNASSIESQISAAHAVENSSANNHDIWGSSDPFENQVLVHTLAEFQSSPDEAAPGSIAEIDDFGDFSGFAADAMNPSSETVANSDTMVPPTPDTIGNDSFGDYSGFEFNHQTSQPENSLRVDESTAEKVEIEDSDNFGDFASFETSTPDEELLQNPEYKNLLMLREFVEKTSLSLPEAIRVQTNGRQVEFSHCFEANIGMEVPVSEVRKKRIQRSIQVMMLLSSSHSKLASTYWQQAIAVTRDEVSMALTVLGEAAGFTESIQAAVRPKLETYVAGLGEFVRICRSIVATIGDLLMLHPSSVLTIDTLSSSWCALNLLKDYLQIENVWKQVEELAGKCGVERKQTKSFELESISEIRLAGVSTAVAGDQLCQFTLQPLSRSDPVITKTPVAFNNGTYMACATNFLIHKCPFYAQSDF